MKKTVIFDLDGTLADTSGDLIAAANTVFRTLGHDEPLDRLGDALTAFHGGRAMLRLGLSRLDAEADDAAIDRMFIDFVAAYTADIDVHTTFYPGVVEAVSALEVGGYHQGICTNKPGKQAEILMQRLGLRDRFASLVAADTLPVRKPDPAPFIESVRRAGGDPARSVLIGDTETDVKTARAAGVPVVLVAFGPEGEGISRLKPDAMLAHYDDLPDLVADLIG